MHGTSSNHGTTASAQEGGNLASGKTVVEVVNPRSGGIDRICTQPGTVEPFEAADLYAKVSGFLAEQLIDIGFAVKEGDILAKIAVPEYEKQAKQDAADIVRAGVDQMKAAITTAQADVGAATAAIALAEAEIKSKSSFRTYREKQRDRIKELVAQMAIDAKLADEQEDQFQAAIGGELAAKESANAARQKEGAAKARVQQAQADVRYAEAEVLSAKARLEKSQVMIDYATIRSPYTGVVTKRNFHRGDFVRAADSGGERTPVLAVERTDRMRIVVQVPERDVPYVDPGDPAIVEVDALPGIRYQTRDGKKVAVSVLAASEDPHTRMMRTEVHVDNADGKLKRGMFGRVTIILESGDPGACRVPSSALTGKADSGKAAVRVIRDGKMAVVPVNYGSDNGSEVEITSGITTADRVVVRALGTVNEGDAVTVVEGRFPAGGERRP